MKKKKKRRRKMMQDLPFLVDVDGSVAYDHPSHFPVEAFLVSLEKIAVFFGFEGRR